MTRKNMTVLGVVAALSVAALNGIIGNRADAIFMYGYELFRGLPKATTQQDRVAVRDSYNPGRYVSYNPGYYEEYNPNRR